MSHEKAKDYNTLSEPAQFSFHRKSDTKSVHRLSFSSQETLQVSNRLPLNKRFSPSVITSDDHEMPFTQSSCGDSLHSLRYSSDSMQSGQSKKLEDALYQQLNLDTHPAVTRLQNEQNLRLEGMEQRMNKIRKNAQQEAERRKFAHLFRARTEEKVKTEKLLKEASVALQLFKKERQMKKSDKGRHLLNCEGSETQNQPMSEVEVKAENDKGDIIPVRIVSEKSTVCAEVKQSGAEAEQPLMWLLQPVERFQLNGVVLWLVLPFLLPVLLLLHLLRHLSPSSDYHSAKKN